MANVIEAAMPQAPNLKPCPFCGGEAEIRKNTLWGREYYMIKCTRCHCSTNKLFTGFAFCFDGQANVDVSDNQAKRKACANWNKRIKEVI